MKDCTSCGAQIDDDAVFCPECGAKQDASAAEPEQPAAAEGTIRCPNCDEEIPADSVFCAECGHKCGAAAPVGDDALRTSVITNTSGSLRTPEAPEERVDTTAAYRDLVEEAYQAGEVSDAVARQLEAKEAELGIAADVARRVRAEVRQEIELDGRSLGESVKLEIDANKILYMKKMGNIDFRLANLSGRQIGNVQITICCQSVEGSNTKDVYGKIRPAERRPIRFNIMPNYDGEDLLEIELKYLPDGGRSQLYRGEAPLEIFDKDEIRTDMSSNISINIDAQNMNAVDMSGLVDADMMGKSPQDILESMRMKKDPIWLQIPLYPMDVEGDEAEEPVKLVEPATDVPPQEALTLQVSSPADLPSTRLRLFSKPALLMGRRPSGNNDVLLWKEPVSDPANRKLSGSISGQHLRIDYTEKGPTVTDLKSSNGTVVSTFSSGYLKPDQPAPLETGSIIRVAGMLELRVDVAMRGEQDDMLAALRQVKVPWTVPPHVPGTSPIGLRSTSPHQWVRFRRNNNPTGEEYLLVVSTADIGSASDCAWVLEHPSVHEHHARIVYFQERYWLYALDKTGITSVNGHSLLEGEAAVLRHGTRLRIGQVEIQAQDSSLV